MPPRVLDGRSRVQACIELGIKCPTRPATPDKMLDPGAASRSLNVHRRHLSTDQIDQILAIYITDNAPMIEADRQAAKAAQRAAKIAKDTGIFGGRSEAGTEGPEGRPREKLADVAAGKVSAGEMLKGAQSGKKKTPKGKAGGDQSLQTLAIPGW